MTAPLRAIRILSDGRPGHLNQSAGLAAALARRTGAAVQTISLPESPLRWPMRFKLAAAPDPSWLAPGLLVGAGHRTHLPAVFAARRFGARSIIIMRPTWSVRLFDLCLIPSHDCTPRCDYENVIQTRGALNRIPERIPAKQPRGVILIGGPSKHYGWEAEPLAEAIAAVLAARPELHWTVGDSHRTPREFLNQLAKRNLAAELVPCQKTTPGWLPEQLLAAEDVWVTEDSVSMLHEAVTAGARTGVLPMPRRSQDARPTRAVLGLVNEGYATAYNTWQHNGRHLPAPKPFNETTRCAELILQRFQIPTTA